MTTTRRYTTNLRCGRCVEAIRPFLDNEPAISRWDVDLGAPNKPLTVRGEASPDVVKAAVAQGGYQILGEIESDPPAPASATAWREDGQRSAGPSEATYYPIVLLGAFLVGVVALMEARAGDFDGRRASVNFMGVFFIAFSFFKLLDLRGFADSYRGYDLVARRFPRYGYVYPFVELGLGAAFIAGFQPFAANLVALVVMAVSSVGVFQSVRNKRAIRCACLGTVFNLPLSTVTLVEDGLMVAMAAVSIAFDVH